MDRAQFMEQLKRLLSDIPEAERSEALDYYNSYFDDAGPENEGAVIRELGSPGKVAAIIKADLQESSDRYAEYTERGYEDTREKEPGQMPEKYAENRDESDSSKRNAKERRFGRDRAYGRGGTGPERAAGRQRAERGYRTERKQNSAWAVLILIALVFASPVIIGGVGGLFGILVVILFLPFILLIVLGAVVVGLIAGGIASAAAGIGYCLVHPAAGVLCIGIGCVLIALGLVCLIPLVWAVAKGLPWLLRMVVDFFSNLVHRGRKDGVGA